VSAAASDNDGDPAVVIVVAGSPACDQVVIQVKCKEGNGDRVELVVA